MNMIPHRNRIEAILIFGKSRQFGTYAVDSYLWLQAASKVFDKSLIASSC